ncbi:antibiotic biosynthesis monooxygenase family protein [Alteromonas gracilis]|uniref:antibiotic biosynthesis monooxygenase family protein n=1 Tax=Alteromonas gracilis TaxID=1479524 RepID=UPI0030D3E083
MYAIVIEFDVKAGKETEFVKYWSQTTEYFLNVHNSCGSRLHKSDTGLYVAYALWPSKAIYEEATRKAPEVSARVLMRKTLKNSSPKVLQKMNVQSDYLVNVYEGKQ